MRERVAELLSLNPADCTLVRLSERHAVWRVCEGGRTIAAAKRFPPPQADEAHAPVEAAAQVLEHVAPPATRCLAWSLDSHLLITEWAGDETLNDYCQRSPERTVDLSHWLVSAFAALESRFAASRESLVPLAQPLDYPRYLRRSLDGALGLASNVFGLPDRVLAVVETQIASTAPTLGPLDCNAQNAAIQGNIVRFFDLAQIGWDWPERRLLQYAFNLGPEGGRPCLAITPASLERYVQRMSEPRHLSAQALRTTVDCHALLASLLVAHRLMELVREPEEYPELVRLWDEPIQRLKHVRAILAAPLSEQPPLLTARRTALAVLDSFLIPPPSPDN